ncbi:hypothetical protein QTN25_007132 [Entamoeba marina]
MKINPYFKIQSINQYIKLFPNIQTIQVPHSHYEISNELLEKVTYIRINDKMELHKYNSFSRYYLVLPQIFGTGDDKYYLEIYKKVEVTRNSNYPSSSSSILNNIFFKKDETVIGKLQEFHIYSFETANFLLNIFKNVFIHSVSGIIDENYINFMKALPFVHFSFTIYTFCSSENNKYKLLNGMSNVIISFSCTTKDILSDGYLITSIPTTTDNNCHQCLKYNDKDYMNSRTIQSLHDTLFKMNYYYLTALYIDYFDMSAQFDFSSIYLLYLSITFNSVSPFDFIIPTSLTSLNLSINKTIKSCNMPNLLFNNASLKELQLTGFLLIKTTFTT